MKTYMLPDPKLGHVTINGSLYAFAAFYYLGYSDNCDNVYHTPYFGNFYPCDFDVTIDGITASFTNAESAYQATKWWHDASVLKHNNKVGKDKNWSDNHDGTGHNWLGLALMEVRSHYGGSGAPSGSYDVVDFTNQIKKDIPNKSL